MKILRIVMTSLLLINALSPLRARDKALLIGIGDYDTGATGWSRIHGNNDVRLLAGKLQKNGFDVSTLVDAEATKRGVINALARLQSGISEGDNIYVHFSGHGQLMEDINNDEPDGLDQTFVCFDACISSKYKISGKSYRGENHLIDDELFPYLNNIKKRAGRRGSLTVVFDACYSGDADRADLVDDPLVDSDVEVSDTVRGSRDEFLVDNYTRNYLKTIPAPGEYSHSGCELTVISACARDKKNFECIDKISRKAYGSLSFCISKLIDRKIPLKEWGYFFKSGAYSSLRILPLSQKPEVKIIK